MQILHLGLLLFLANTQVLIVQHWLGIIGRSFSATSQDMCYTIVHTSKIEQFWTWASRGDGIYVENISKHSHGRKLVEITPIIHQLTSNIICRMLFGTSCEKSNDLLGNNFDNFFQSNREMLKIMNKLNINDLIPILKWFDL